MVMVIVAMVLSITAHAHAATTVLSFERGAGGAAEDPRRRATAPAPTPAPAPAGHPPERDAHGIGRAKKVVIKRDMHMHELFELCRDTGCVLTPGEVGRDGDRYLVTTGTSAAAADQDGADDGPGRDGE